MKPHLYLLPLLLLVGCSDSDAPPRVDIKSPAPKTTVSGTVQLQAATDNPDSIFKVTFKLRGVGSTLPGATLHSTTLAPYQADWLTTTVPNHQTYELYAEALGTNGQTAQSAPVQINVNNPGSPELDYLLGYTLPTRACPSSLMQNQTGSTLWSQPTQPQNLRAPTLVTAPRNQKTNLQAQATTNSCHVLQWSWPAHNDTTEAYGVYVSNTDIAGPYGEPLLYQSATLSPNQQYSAVVTKPDFQATYHGAITAVNNQQTESGMSNADSTGLLEHRPLAVSPAQNSTQNGNITLRWEAYPHNPETTTIGYVAYLYTQDPATTRGLKPYWSNDPFTIQDTELEVSKALPAGTYYWWVAAVRFKVVGKDKVTEALSFSDPLKFTVQ